ncbi:hypothetical protein MPTK2_8g16161 [Marchantia polymorpha subsp. ruderalis]
MKVARYSAFRLRTGEGSFVLCADEVSSPVHRRFGVGGKSALGPRNAPCEVESVRRLLRQRSAADGQVSAVDGQDNAADGQVSAADGQLSAADGQVIAADGQLSAADSQVIAADGLWIGERLRRKSKTDITFSILSGLT